MSVWFTADLHLGHEMVAGLRGFDSKSAHDAAIAEAWAERVRPADVVWVLGDLTLARPEKIIDTIRSLPGRKRLILGNHDRGHPLHRDAHKTAAVYQTMFEWVSTSARTRICGTDVLLSHFPYSRDHTAEVRHEQWRLPDLGMPLVHGHTHSQHVSQGHEVHVGLDAWDLAPVRDDVLAPLLDAQPKASEVAPTPCPSCGAPTWDGLHRNGFRECVMAEVETS